MEKYCPKCFNKFPPSVDRCPQDGSYLVSPMDRDLTGQVLDDRYTVLERIGRGGMGVVYKAEQHLIQRIVALKVLRREIVEDETAVKRFLNEARAIASLDSQHTVTLHDFGVTQDGLLYYTMELLKGRPLSRVIRDEAPIRHARAAQLLIQACESLEEAHKAGILHRDIKPDNLFVTEKGGKEHIKVLDFGIAKLVGDAKTDTVTRTGMIIGTPQYLSPEQALGNPVVPASDLYSLGIVLYEMLAGVPPFQDETPMKTMWAQIRDPLPPLREKNPNVEVPRSIEAFLAEALEKDPGSRFQTATAFAEALRTAFENHEATPETVSLPALSTTGEGLRLKTQAWEGQAGGRIPEAGRGNRQTDGRETAMLAGGVMAGKAELGMQPRRDFPHPRRVDAPPKKKSLASPDVRVDGPGRPRPSPASAEDEKASQHEMVAPPPPTARAVPPSLSDQGACIVPTDESLRSVPGSETGEMLAAGSKRFVWAGASAAAVGVVVALLVWQPWADGDAGQLETARGVPAAVVAAAVQAEKAGEAEEMRKAEEARKKAAIAEEKQKAEEARKAEEAKSAEEARKAAEAEEAKRAAQAEEARKVEEERKAEEAKIAAQAEEMRKAEEAKRAAQAETARKVEEERKAEEAKIAAQAEEMRRAEEAERAEEARKAARAVQKLKAEEDRKLLERLIQVATEAEEAEERRKAEEATKAEEARKAAEAEGARKAEEARKVAERELEGLVGKGNSAFAEKKWAECVKHFEAVVKLGGLTPEMERKLKKCREMSVFQK